MGIGIKYDLYICDIDYNKIAKLDYIFLQYSDVINSIAQAYFVMQTQSPAFKRFEFDPIGKIYTIIIERNGVEKFRGEIDRIATPDNNTPVGVNLQEAYGTMDRIEFNASQFFQRAANLVVTGKEADGTANTNYVRTFADNTKIGDAITTFLNEAKNIPGSPVKDLIIGTVENPLDTSGAEITIGSDQSLYASDYLYAVSLLSSIGGGDFYFSDSKTINFVNKRQTDLSESVKLRLIKGDSSSNLTGITFKIDRQGMSNQVIVLGSGEGLNISSTTTSNTNSVSNFGLRQKVILARDLDTTETIKLYAKTVLNSVSTAVPASSVFIYPKQEHTPFQNFQKGDVVSLDVDWDFVRFKKNIRITGALISVENNGVERIYYSIEEAK